MSDPGRVRGADDLLARLEQLNHIGIALSKEKDITRLLEVILVAAKDITHADGGTLYRMTEEQTLKFEIIRNDTLGIAMGGTTGVEIPFYPINLYDKEGKPIHSMVAAYAVHHDRSVNIADAYTAEGFDFTGTQNFDKKTGYRSRSFLTVPMKNHENEIIGVLQLINSKDPASGAVVPFSDADQHLAESLASQAAVALENTRLYESIQRLFEGFVGAAVTAIEARDPATSGHSFRVAALTLGLAEAVHRCSRGRYADTRFKTEELRELRELTGDENGAQRVAWTETWTQAKEWLSGKLAPLGVEEDTDAAGNQWFTLRGASEREKKDQRGRGFKSRSDAMIYFVTIGVPLPSRTITGRYRIDNSNQT